MATSTIETESPSETVASAPILDEPALYRLDADQYFQLIKAGILPETVRVFLWNGQLVETMTTGPEHGYSQTMVMDLLRPLVPKGWFLRPALPVVVTPRDVPEPDVSVVRGRARDYQHQTPQGENMALAIEVADSSLRYDSRKKRDLYAKARVPVYWIVNIPENRIDVYSEPTGPSETPLYRERRSYCPGDEFPVVLDGLEVGRIAVSDVL